MNLFEKIHNYQLLTRLDEAGTYPVTTHEKAWLIYMLGLPSAADFFEADTIEKLRSLLGDRHDPEQQELFVEKAGSRTKHVWHPLVRRFRRIILAKNHVYLTATTKKGRNFRKQRAVPYKLEYSLVKKAWYLIWLHVQSEKLITTPLDQIQSAEEIYIEDAWYDSFFPTIQKRIEQRKQIAKVHVVQRYHGELQRILYAFSCFDKEVDYDHNAATYTITLHYMEDEQEYILSRIRFLGLRVKVVENDALKKRMAESAAKALERYQDE